MLGLQDVTSVFGHHDTEALRTDDKTKFFFVQKLCSCHFILRYKSFRSEVWSLFHLCVSYQLHAGSVHCRTVPLMTSVKPLKILLVLERTEERKDTGSCFFGQVQSAGLSVQPRCAVLWLKLCFLTVNHDTEVLDCILILSCVSTTQKTGHLEHMTNCWPKEFCSKLFDTPETERKTLRILSTTWKESLTPKKWKSAKNVFTLRSSSM